MNRKTIGLFWQFRPRAITIRYTTTSVTFKYVVDKLGQGLETVQKENCEYEGQKNTCREKTD